MSITAHQRKVLLQLSDNPYITPKFLRLKRAMAPVLKLVELGYLTTVNVDEYMDPVDEDDEPCFFYLTEKGKAALQRT